LDKTLFQGDRSGSIGKRGAPATDKGKIIRVSDIKAVKNQATSPGPMAQQDAPQHSPIPFDPWNLLDSADREDVIKILQEKLEG